MVATWKSFAFNVWPTLVKAPAAKDPIGSDPSETGALGCKVTDDVWKSAVYLGAGGPVMRDH